MKVPFTLVDFSGGMKGKKGQLNSADLKHVQDINNFLVERNNTLRTRNGVEKIPFTLLANDKVLPFVYNGKKYYFVYDPLLKLRYKTQAGSTSFTYSMGGQRHVDMFSRYNSSMSVKDYIFNEYYNHVNLVQSKFDINYTGLVTGSPQDDIAKWTFFKDYPATNDLLDVHLHLRKLTWESSPTFVFTEKNRPELDAHQLYHASTAHAVVENTFWWNRMFVLDEDFNVITNEVDIANFVSYDSGHELKEGQTIPICDTDVRDSTHEGLQAIREARYGGSDETYEVEVMSQGIIFYNQNGKLPNMFMQINEEGQTDGVLRDFRTLYLDEVPNGIFKTAPYFTLDEYASQELFDKETMRVELNFLKDVLVPDFGTPPDAFFSSVAQLNSYYQANTSADTANNDKAKFSYNVKDELNSSDVQKGYLPLTSDSSPVVEIDNIRLEDPDGQVRFTSPSLANMDRDYVFVHDSQRVWENEDLASELPFIFSPSLMIYHRQNGQEPISLAEIKRADPILRMVRNNDLSNTFALIPISPYAGGAIGKFNAEDVGLRPIRITGITDQTTVTTQDADYLPLVVYTQVHGLYKFDSSLNVQFITNDNTYPIRLGYFVSQDNFSETFFALNNFKSFVTTYTGTSNVTKSTGWFTSTEKKSEYSFKVFSSTGGSQFSIITTAENQVSKAIGFNSGNYFSAIAEFNRRLYLASREAPNRLLYSSVRDYLDFSTISARVNNELVAVATRGGRNILGNEAIAKLHKSNDSLRVITNRRILSAVKNEDGTLGLADPSDIVTADQSPVTINNFTYFVSGDRRDVLLSVFSDKTQRFEYYSVFSEINVDDETKILQFLPLASSYRMVIQTEQGIYIGTIIQANQVAWSRLTFSFEVTGLSSTNGELFINSNENIYRLGFLESTDIEDGVFASFKLLSPVAMANLVNVPKTNINTIGMRLQDITIVGTFNVPLRSGSDERKLASTADSDIVEIANKNFNDLYDSIEFSFKGGQNRVVYLRGSLGV